MVEKLGEITEREFRGYWDKTIRQAARGAAYGVIMVTACY
jgi:hypothetical protein